MNKYHCRRIGISVDTKTVIHDEVFEFESLSKKSAYENINNWNRLSVDNIQSSNVLWIYIAAVPFGY